MSMNRLQIDPMPLPSSGSADDEGYRIFIRDLVLLCSIGAYPEERLKPQRVRFNVDMRVREARGPIDDDLVNVLSYDTVIADIRELAGRGHINLVETLAQDIIECCLADPRVLDVRVAVEKLDVEPAAAGVGVEIARRRRAYPAVAELFPRRHTGS
jgi:dihydroneopterin aldolase